MAKVKIVPLRSFFAGELILEEGRQTAVEEEMAAEFVKNGWAAPVPEKEKPASGGGEDDG